MTEKGDGDVFVMRVQRMRFSELNRGDIFRKEFESGWNMVLEPVQKDEHNTWGCKVEQVAMVPTKHPIIPIVQVSTVDKDTRK